MVFIMAGVILLYVFFSLYVLPMAIVYVLGAFGIEIGYWVALLTIVILQWLSSLFKPTKQ